MLSTKARTLRRTQTEPERRLWSLLRNRQMGGHKFRRQYPFDCYILDFACIERKLAVEADGGQHDGAVDRARDTLLEAHGWRVLRFSNADILNHQDAVAEAILMSLSS